VAYRLGGWWQWRTAIRACAEREAHTAAFNAQPIRDSHEHVVRGDDLLSFGDATHTCLGQPGRGGDSRAAPATTGEEAKNGANIAAREDVRHRAAFKLC